MLVDQEAAHCSAHAVQLLSSWDMKPIASIVPTSEAKLSPATTLFNLEFMLMVLMSNLTKYYESFENASKHTVWTSEIAGDFFWADSVIFLGDTVSFRLKDKEVKVYDRHEFFKFNPNWKSLENTE